MDYFAHTYGKDQSQWQPLREHLENVAKLAAKFASQARPGDNPLGVKHLEFQI